MLLEKTNEKRIWNYKNSCCSVLYSNSPDGLTKHRDVRSTEVRKFKDSDRDRAESTDRTHASRTYTHLCIATVPKLLHPRFGYRQCPYQISPTVHWFIRRTLPPTPTVAKESQSHRKSTALAGVVPTARLTVPV